MAKNYNLNSQTNINIINTVATCSYPPNFRDFIVNLISELASSKGAQFFKVNRNRGNVVDTIIAVKYNIQTIFSLKTYEIPIIIYVNKSFPYEAPEIYLERRDNTGVNPKNTDIDQNTYRIVTPQMKTWNQFSTIPNLLLEITNSFNKTFPIFSTKTKVNVSANDPSQVVGGTQTNFNQIQGGGMGGGYQGYGQSPYQPPQPQQPQYQQPYGGGYNPNPGFNYGAQDRPFVPDFGANKPQDKPIYQQPQPVVNETPEEGIKRILIEEIMSTIDPKIREEVRLLKQQEEKLKNYKNEFTNQIDKYQKVLSTSGNVQTEFQNVLKNCDSEINSLRTYLAENSNKELNSKNFENFIQIANQRILRIVSIEATIDDFQAVVRKAFERGVISFDESVKFIRSLTREAMKVKYYRDLISKRL